MSQLFPIPFYFFLTVVLDKNPYKLNYILAYATQRPPTNTPYLNNSITCRTSKCIHTEERRWQRLHMHHLLQRPGNTWKKVGQQTSGDMSDA